MNAETEETPAKPSALINPASSVEALRVEIRVHEQGTDAIEVVSEKEAAFRKWTSAQGWLVRLTVLAVVMAVAGIYAGFHISRGWAPSDDGTLSQSALRVMQGQLPHRDFAEIYTGGLSFIHALAFRSFGVNLMSLRICVFLFFLAWLPAVYYIALRFTSAMAAGAITLLAVAWGYPNYPAAMPSWYNLFFATFGAAALLRYLDVRTRRWLFVAGVCGGVSILIKVIGAYYVAGALLFLAFLEQSENQSESESAKGESSNSSWPYRVFSVSALLLFLAIVLDVLHARLGPAELYHFVLPSAVVVGLILAGERSVRAGTAQRFKTIFRAVIPFLGGVISPVIVFLLPYARSGAIGQFFSGVTSSAITRSIELGLLRPVSVEKSIYALALVGLVAAAMYLRELQGKLVSAAVALGLAVMLVKAEASDRIIL